MLEPGADPVRKVSIIPRGHALGVTFQSPEKDRYGFDEQFLRGRMTGLLGGQAAEELIYGAVTTGAESDLDQATALARHMVGRWGMSDKVGLVTVLPPDGTDPFLMGKVRRRSAPGSSSTRRSGGSPTSVMRAQSACLPSTASSSTRLPGYA
jgi:ATP-dependent Zn protease